MATRVLARYLYSTRRLTSTSTSTSALPRPSNLALKVSPFAELDSHLASLHPSLSPKVAEIRSRFVAPDEPKVHNSTFAGAGVSIDPSLVVTTARVVGRAVSIRKSGGPIAYIGRTTAFNSDGNDPVALTPLAVSFASDVAVLRVTENWLPVCLPAASPPEKESILASISYEQIEGWGMSLANVRSVGKKTIKAMAPWPLDDGLAWIEHDWLAFYRGPPPPSSVLFNSKETTTGSLTKMSGSPWFNLYGELVGMASWVLRDDPAAFSVGYAAPLSNIWPVVEYAKAKGANDPVVMDRWIKSEVIGGDEDEDEEKEG